MKELFSGALAVLCVLSGVAYLWQPRPESARLDRIRAVIAGGRDGVPVAAVRARWAELGRGGQEGIDYLDFPDAVLARLPASCLDPLMIPADALTAYLTQTTRPGRGDAALLALSRAHAGGVAALPEASVALRRLRGALVLDAIAAAGFEFPERDAVRRRMAIPDEVRFDAFLREGPPLGAADRERIDALTYWIFEADLDDDFTLTADEADGYLARLDSDGDGTIGPSDLPERPIPLLWSSAPGSIRTRQIEAFNRRYPKHALALDAYVSSIDKVIVQCLAGVGPDIFDAINPFQLAAFVNSGVARDVTEAFAERGIRTDDIWPAVAPYYMMDGRIYGHPRNAGAPAMWFNKDMFDAAGIPYPAADWTWDDFIAIAQRLTERDAAGRPTRFGMISTWDHTSWFPIMITRQWGAPLFNAEGTRCVIDGPAAEAAFRFTQEMMYTARVMPTPSDEAAMANAGGWGGGALTLFAGGRGAMAIGYRWWLVVLREPEFAHLNLGVVPLPATPGGAIEGGGGAVIVNQAARNLEGAMRFMEFLHSAAYNDLNNDAADSLSPVRTFYYGESETDYLDNPRFPHEDYHAVWRDVLAQAEPPNISPYINGQLAERIVLKYGDFIKYRSEDRDIGSILSALAAEMNRAIVASLRENPPLRERYMRAVAAGAAPAWDRPEDAP